MPNQFDKPVETVLEDYNLLNVSVIQDTNSINMSTCKLWRMNLCAVSDAIPCTFYVAMNYKINVYTLDTISSPFKEPSKTIASPNAVDLNVGVESPYMINAIKVGKVLNKEVLISVSENGEVCLWETENLDEPPFILNNHISTWGIAIHGEQGLLAVSANNWKITLFNLSQLTTRFGQARPNALGTIDRTHLIGHEHNIPNIDFDPTGQYLASASVDATCRIWDLSRRQVVTLKKSSRYPEQESWFWAVRFIPPGHFKFTHLTDRSIQHSFVQRTYQGRSTSFSQLGLTHSARHPAFPMNVARLFDLDQHVDFEIFEEDEGFIQARSDTTDLWEQQQEEGWATVVPDLGLSWTARLEMEPERSGADVQTSLGQYLMITTGKDVSLVSTDLPRMQRVRTEHNIISKVDIRSDQLLNVLDRINMVEWLPELELFIAASQKGTVALMRLIQIDLDGESQAVVFNTECYLPDNVLQSTPLYGMTVKKIEGERFSSVAYQVFLFYYSGNILGYNISRNESDLVVDEFIF